MSVTTPLEVSDPAGVMAAVDLGSNSFHMVVARAQHGQLAIVDRLREMVRLASGLSASGYLDNDSQDRALAALRRFGQRLKDMHAEHIRVVGTNTLRTAKNSDVFLSAAEDALGLPVDVISGMEEARLIYLGVSRHSDSSSGGKLVIDIGGGSTELIIGEGFEPVQLESLAIGCVGLSRRFFDGGRIGHKRFARARLAARQELRPVAARFRRHGWAHAIGSSGTVRCVDEIVALAGVEDDGVTFAAVEQIIDQMVEAQSLDKLELPGLSADRAPVFAGGIAILAEFLSEFGIERLAVSDGALREGLLYDMIGRQQSADAREVTIRGLQTRFHIDIEQAERVEQTAQCLLEGVADHWSLSDPKYSQLLQWAARLHEIGLDIAHSRHHQHGAYLLANADLPGFARLEQQLLACLVGNHRRKLELAMLGSLKSDWQTPVLRLIVLLRLAVVLNRARSSDEAPAMQLTGGTDRLEAIFPKRWFTANPLTHADLMQEQEYLGGSGFELALATASD